MNLIEAQFIANHLVEQIRPFCERVEIAGSIRREKPCDIKDVEIVAIPKWVNRHAEGASANLFDDEPATVRVNLLYEWALRVCPIYPEGAPPREGVRWIKTGTPDIVHWLPKPDGKYWRGLLPNGCKLDLFLASPEAWGPIFLIRTGSADFSHSLVTFARFKAGYTFNSGEIVDNRTGLIMPAPEEEDVFRILNLQFVEPKQRIDADAILPVRMVKGGR